MKQDLLAGTENLRALMGLALRNNFLPLPGHNAILMHLNAIDEIIIEPVLAAESTHLSTEALDAQTQVPEGQ